jgi:hypothetical protein
MAEPLDEHRARVLLDILVDVDRRLAGAWTAWGARRIIRRYGIRLGAMTPDEATETLAQWRRMRREAKEWER